MAEHTELPWFTDRKFVVGPRPSTNDQSDGMLCGIADVYGDNAKEDAAFIVKACNSHVGLLELAAEAMWHRDYPHGGSVYKTYDSLNHVDKELYRAEALEAALLAAREVKP